MSIKNLQEIQKDKKLSWRERWRANRAWKNEFMDASLLQDLYRNLVSHLALLAVFITFAFFLLWAIFMKEVRFFPFYVLLACAAFLIPFFFLDVIRMIKLIRRERKESTRLTK